MKYAVALLIALATVWPGAASAAPVAAALAPFAAWYAAQTALVQIGVQLAFSIGLGLASYGLQYAVAGSGRRQTDASTGPNVLVPQRDGLLTRRRIYGTQVVSGAVFHQATVSDGIASGPNIYVLGVALSEGPCDSLVSVIINGVECALDASGYPLTSPWRDASGVTYLKASFRSGTDSQTIDPIIAARFPAESSNYRQRGVATVVLEMAFGADASQHTALWGAAGIPQLGFKIRGLRIYDPRNPAHLRDDSATWTWSANATLIEADYLRSAIGFGVDPATIDWDSVAVAANIDDEWIPTLTGVERRYTINGEVRSTERNSDVLTQMQQQNRGLIRYAQGVYTFRSEAAPAAHATLHQGLLVGDLNYTNEPAMRSSINRIPIQYYPAAKFNQSAEIVYEDLTAQAADGEILEQRISLRFCDSASLAQRLGYAMLAENRVGRAFAAQLDIGALIAAGKPNQLLEAGDFAHVELAAPYDGVNGLYRVNAIEINGDFTVTVTMSGTSPDIINGWSIALEQPLT